MDGNQREIDQIAEYADSRVRAVLPAPAPEPAPKEKPKAMPRRGSLPGIAIRKGLAEQLYRNWGNAGNGIYTFIGSLLLMMLIGGIAWATDQPFLFPSLGATVFLFFETPMAEVSSARNTVIGHYVGAAVAYFWLFVFGLIDQPTAIAVGFTAGRWAAVALSLAFTGLFLRLLRAAHPPAGATTVIVALGLLDNGTQMLVLAGSVLVVAAVCGILNRIFGVPAPLWAGPYQRGAFTRLLGLGGKQQAAAAGSPAALGSLSGLFQTAEYSPVPGALAAPPPAGAQPQRPYAAPPQSPPRQPQRPYAAPPQSPPRQPAPQQPPPADATQARPIPQRADKTEIRPTPRADHTRPAQPQPPAPDRPTEAARPRRPDPPGS